MNDNGLTATLVSHDASNNAETTMLATIPCHLSHGAGHNGDIMYLGQNSKSDSYQLMATFVSHYTSKDVDTASAMMS